MSINEEHHQASVAEAMTEQAHTLAHSTRTVTVPAESCQIIGELRATVGHLAQVSRQLSAWHESVSDSGLIASDSRGEDGNVQEVASALMQAAWSLDGIDATLSRAHSDSSAIRWAAGGRA